MVDLVKNILKPNVVMPTVHLIIKGEVQGVFYRATAKKTADELGISGWIKNTEEGNVEALVTGSRQQLVKFISWCKQGPVTAKISEVVSTEQTETFFESFVIIR